MLNKEERKAIIDERLAWRNTFNTPQGRIVFRRMMIECYFLNDNLTPDDIDGIGKSNYFRTIIERLGCGNDPGKTAYAVSDAILNALTNLPVAIKEDNEENE